MPSGLASGGILFTLYRERDSKNNNNKGGGGVGGCNFFSSYSQTFKKTDSFRRWTDASHLYREGGKKKQNPPTFSFVMVVAGTVPESVAEWAVG